MAKNVNPVFLFHKSLGAPSIDLLQIIFSFLECSMHDNRKEQHGASRLQIPLPPLQKGEFWLVSLALRGVLRLCGFSSGVNLHHV